MGEYPILFTTENVKNILENRKSQTRRVIKHPESYEHIRECDFCCPYGQVGDRLWVKETHYRFGHWSKNGFSKTGKQKWLFKANDKEVRYFDNPPTENLHSLGEKNAVGWFKRSSLFLPRWASRITLEITEIRVQRVQEISLEDAEAEGVNVYDSTGEYGDVLDFRTLWNKINGKKYPWEDNCWVWAISFKRVEK